MMGVKGMPPLGCLPLWGREGVTLITLIKYTYNGLQRISAEPKKTG